MLLISMHGTFSLSLVLNDIVVKQIIMHIRILHILSPQINSDFHLDAHHEVKLRYALGGIYGKMGKYMEAREVLEKALMVCNKEGIKEAREGAGVAAELGWIYM